MIFFDNLRKNICERPVLHFMARKLFGLQFDWRFCNLKKVDR